MGRAKGLNKADSFTSVLGETRGHKRHQGSLEPELANKITYVIRNGLREEEAIYLGQEKVWQGDPDDMKLVDVLEKMKVPFVFIDNQKEKVKLPGGEDADSIWMKNGDDLLSRIQFSRGSCPLTVLTTGPPYPFLAVYYKGRRILQGSDGGIEELDRILEKLPNKFRMVYSSAHNDVFSEDFPDQLPVWLVREENVGS